MTVKPSQVGIIDYGMGNLTSVKNAFAALGQDVRVIDRVSELGGSSHIVLPGVGAFAEGMRKLNSGGWDEALQRQVIEQGKPFLGICLGMHLIAERGTEHGLHDGLGWVAGDVVRLPDPGHGPRVPHIGWNDAVPIRRDGVYRNGFDRAGVFYYVHSYHLVPVDAGWIDAVCDHGISFAASISKDNIWAVQFHPEKSQAAGLQVLRNFIEVN